LHPDAGGQLGKEIVLLPSYLLNLGGVGCTNSNITNPTNDSSSSDEFQVPSSEDGTQNNGGIPAVEESGHNTTADDPGV
jgi:hypothetical protein